MDKNKNLQALDDEALDQVSGGVQFTTLIHKDKKGKGWSSEGAGAEQRSARAPAPPTGPTAGPLAVGHCGHQPGPRPCS